MDKSENKKSPERRQSICNSFCEMSARFTKGLFNVCSR